MKLFSKFNTMVLATLALGLVTVGAQAASPVPPSSPAAAGQEDIRDIRPPIHIAPPFPWLAWTAGGIAVAALGFASWKLLRRKNHKNRYEIALERLEKTRALMHEVDAEPFCLAISEIVREFVEETLPVRAMHRTTDEFLRDLTDLSCNALIPHRGTLANFLEHCDLAKFARWSLTIPQMEALLESAKEFVIDLGRPAPAKSPKEDAKPMLATT